MDVLTVDFDRVIQARSDVARRTVLAALSEAGFRVDRVQGAVIEARKGSALIFCVGLSVTVTEDNGLSRIHVHLADRQMSPLRLKNAHAQYAAAFADIQQRLDSDLLGIDPSLVVAELPPVSIHPERQPTAGDQFRDLVNLIPGSSGSAVRRVFHTEPGLWVVCSENRAYLTADQAQMCLAVASIAIADPAALKPPLSHQVATLTPVLRQAIREAKPPAGRVDIPIETKSAADFLYKQAIIRERLAVREIHTCRDCGYEWIVNPDYRKRLADKAMMVAVGNALSSVLATTHPFLYAGRLMNAQMLKPATACKRCEGTETDISLAAICPNCRTIRADAVLTRCRHKDCGHDFLASAKGESLWAKNEAVMPNIGVAAESSGETRDNPGLETSDNALPGWYPDPAGHYQIRWFDNDWTSWVANGANIESDPLAY